MKPVPINYLAVAAAALSNMFIGFVWYGPLFGKIWMTLSGITPGKWIPPKHPAWVKRISWPLRALWS